MLRRVRKTILRWFLITGFILLLIAIPRKYLVWRYRPNIHQPNSSPFKTVAIVFGAGLRQDGLPSNVLEDRVRVASELYQQGVVSMLMVSGSVRTPNYDEPKAMRELAIELGVASDDILIDPNGSRTYNTCFNAKHIFNINEAILVSQEFHLPRALGICDALGIDAEGVVSDLRNYNSRALRYWEFREIPASWVALWDAYIAKPDVSTQNAPVGMKVEERDYYDS
jgi:vancomycin permeability regulator SanA